MPPVSGRSASAEPGTASSSATAHARNGRRRIAGGVSARPGHQPALHAIVRDTAPMLHVTNGDSAVAVLRAAGVAGDLLPWRDALHEGPVRAGLDPARLRAERARYMAARGWADEATALAALTARDERLDRAVAAGEDVVLWFESDLYDVLQLAQVADRLAPGAARLVLVGEEEFRGVAELSAGEVRAAVPAALRPRAVPRAVGRVPRARPARARARRGPSTRPRRRPPAPAAVPVDAPTGSTAASARCSTRRRRRAHARRRVRRRPAPGGAAVPRRRGRVRVPRAPRRAGRAGDPPARRVARGALARRRAPSRLALRARGPGPLVP